jgi:hypothetical protein
MTTMRLMIAEWSFYPIQYTVNYSQRTIDWMWFSRTLDCAAK